MYVSLLVVLTRMRLNGHGNGAKEGMRTWSEMVIYYKQVYELMSHMSNYIENLCFLFSPSHCTVSSFFEPPALRRSVFHFITFSRPFSQLISLCCVLSSSRSVCGVYMVQTHTHTHTLSTVNTFKIAIFVVCTFICQILYISWNNIYL